MTGPAAVEEMLKKGISMRSNPPAKTVASLKSLAGNLRTKAKTIRAEASVKAKTYTAAAKKVTAEAVHVRKSMMAKKKVTKQLAKEGKKARKVMKMD